MLFWFDSVSLLALPAAVGSACFLIAEPFGKEGHVSFAVHLVDS